MSTTAAPNLTQDPSSFYDPDEVLPKNSPILASHELKLQPSPSPPPFSLAKTHSPPSFSNRRSNRPRIKPSQGDAVLVALLDGGRRPEIAIHAGTQVLPSDPEDEESDSETSDESDSLKEERVPLDRAQTGRRRSKDGQGTVLGLQEGKDRTMTTDSARRPDTGAFLKSLAAGALAVTETTKGDTDDAGLPPLVAEQVLAKEKRHATSIPAAIATRREDLYPEERLVTNAGPSPFSPRSIYSPREPGHIMQQKVDLRSPTVMGSSVRGELPPIQINSPRSDTNGQTPLPSIRAQLGDWKELADSLVDNQGHLRHPTFSHSPPGSLPRFPPMHRPHHGSPPISPAETLRRDVPSPGHALIPPGVSPYNFYHQQANGLHRHNQDYSSPNDETPNTDQSGSTPATSITDRLSIDGLTNPANGAFVCKFSGCSAPPFQTQYLLNSHANVHSSARPHYCPVKGCPRSETGKGFKRKNEMIRHGLVHDSPGYVCPFCPDREHRYPRPDNLQRYVSSNPIATSQRVKQRADLGQTRTGTPRR